MKKLCVVILFALPAVLQAQFFEKMRFYRDGAAPATLGIASISITDAGNMTITGSPCASVNCDFTLASTGGGGGGAPTSVPFVTLAADAGVSAEFSLGSLTTGLLLNTSDGTTGTLSQYAGIDCTNQFVRDVDASGAGTCATVALANDVSGTLAAAQFPALTGAITTSAGNLTTSLASAAVTYAKIQNVAANRLLGNASGSAAAPAEVPWNSTLEIATGSLGRAATTGDVVCPSASNACTIQAGAVVLTTDVTGILPEANGGTGLSALGANVLTFLGTPTTANFLAAVTGETGTGAVVFATSPTLVTPLLGTPTSGVATNLTGLPLTTGVTGTLPLANGGTGVTSAADDALLVGSGTGWVAQSLPSCSAQASALIYDNTANTIGCTSLVDIQVSTPGTPQTGNLNIDGKVIGGAGIQVNGLEITPLVVTTSANVAAASTDYECDATAGNVVMTLSGASTNGRVFRMRKIDSTANTCAFTRSASDTIEGATSVTLSTQWARVSVIGYASAKWGINDFWPVTAGVTVNNVVQPVADTVHFIDSSTGGVAAAKAGLLHGGRGGATCYDEMFYISSASGFWNCSIKNSMVGTATALSVATGETNHPGEITCTTGSDTTGTCGLQQGGVTTTATTGSALRGISLGGGRAYSGVVAKVDTASSAVDIFTAWVGGYSDQVLTTASTAPTDGVFFRYTHSVNSAEWQGVAVSNSVETTCDTNVARDANFHTFEIDVNAAGTSVDFTIDGSFACTVASNIPNAAGRETAMMPIAIQKAGGSTGTTARLLTIDAYWYALDFTTAR